MLGPSRPRCSNLRAISSIGTGFETLSYSLQYAQERLQKRAGTICAITGCPVDASARPTSASSRTLRIAANLRPRTVALRGVAMFTIQSYFAHIQLLQRGNPHRTNALSLAAIHLARSP